MPDPNTPLGLPFPPEHPIIEGLRNAEVAYTWRLFFQDLCNFLASAQMRGLRSDQPAADNTFPGTSYYVVDEDLWEWSDGVEWFDNPMQAIVSVAVGGALEGDGTPGDPLSVRVDGVTIIINGSNQLEVIGGGSVDGNWVPLSAGLEPLQFISDGHGQPIMTWFSPDA